MESQIIFSCKNGHFFITEICPYCGEKKEREYERRFGDCIKCGQLCPDGAYACNTPSPLDSEE